MKKYGTLEKIEKIYFENEEISNFKNLIGKTLIKIVKVMNAENENDGLLFITSENEKYILIHFQDCCEDVYLESITGDIKDVLNFPVIKADVIENSADADYGSVTYSFYEIATMKGTITIRFNGYSNGFYSESVGFYKIRGEE
ncbi:hypothetical protein EOM09_03765 [bacterium]|nr:hypothetical protein [bacterium]